MKTSTRIALSFVSVIGSLATACQSGPSSAANPVPPTTRSPVSEQIIVDQFGWRADAPRKVAIMADPVQGQNAANHYIPGDTFEIRRADDGNTVYTGKIISWHNGEVQKTSGDKVWWCDFSDFSTPGRYVLYDPKNNRQSYPFSLKVDVFNPVLKTAVRMFYYQRCGTDIDASHGGNWTHPACHIGPGQDKEAQLYIDSPKGSPRDVSGGWHDAGDDTKYVPFLPTTVGDLLSAYELNPKAFGDHTNIPESGNGVPDILDEIKWELDWLLKMQNPDGSVCNRVSEKSYSNGKGPADDTQPRYYTQATTWSTAIFAGILAHAARLFPAYEATYPGYSGRLKVAALKAWSYLEKTPQMFPTDGQDGAKMAAAPGESNPHADKRLRILAAAELFATTHEDRFHSYFKANYKDKVGTEEGNHHPLVDGSFDADQTPDLNRAFFIYAQAKGADPTIVGEIKTALKNTMENTLAPSYEKGEDAYRAFMWDGHYTWGSNQAKANWGKIAVYAAVLNANPPRTALYREIAEEYLHYFHGRNPLSWVYLSNMGDKGAKLGASKSVMEIYHHWFQDGSPLYDGANSQFGPAPGFLAGGPNQNFSRAWISPPHGEPPMKAYRDWNGNWNKEKNDTENSWEVTEPAIYYQAAYVFLATYFATPETH
jgi:hypothetical protein